MAATCTGSRLNGDLTTGTPTATSVYPPTVLLAGKTMNLHLGQETTWPGRANASLGYHWECVMNPPDGLDLTIDPIPDYADPVQHNGSGGTEHLTWRAAKPGTVGVTLQRWFRGQKTDEFTVTVVVSGQSGLRRGPSGVQIGGSVTEG